MTLSDTLTAFLDAADEADGATLANTMKGLVCDAARCVADHSCGEVAAICQRASVALIWLAAEAKDPDSRANRHGRMRAVLDLMDLCEAVRRFHSGRGDDDALAAMRAEITYALKSLVDAGDDG